MKKKQIISHPDKKMLEFEGKKFRVKRITYKKIDGIEHQDKIIFEEINESKEQERVDYIKDKLKEKVPAERIIEEILKEMPTSSVKKLERILKEKKTNVKRQDGCLGLYVDGGKYNSMYLDLYD